jgi:Spy/CpxP family protein refolding chaperone
MSAARSRAATAKALLAAASLLVLGGVLGVAVDRHVLSRPAVAGPANFHDLAALQDRLNLDASQRRQLDSIISAHHAMLQRTWAELHADLGASVDSVHASLEAVLTPEQREEFRAWLREMHGGGGH